MKKLGILVIFTLIAAVSNAKNGAARKPSDAGSGGTGEFVLSGKSAQALFDKMANSGFDMGDGSGYINKTVTCKVSNSVYNCEFIDPTTYQGQK